MSCKGCGSNSSRYDKKEMPEDKSYHQKTVEAFDELLDKDLPIDHSGPYSLDTLISMKSDQEKAEFEKFRAGLAKMSYDERIFHVMTLVDVINGEQYSPLGHSPLFCICLLHKILDFPEFSCANEKFPGLKEEIASRYENILKNRISLTQ